VQHSSTILGGLIIALTVYKLPVNKPENGNIQLRYWGIFAGLCLAMISIRFLSGLEFKQFGNVIVTAISAGLISLTLTSWLTRTK
jgi:hypothetical protein